MIRGGHIREGHRGSGIRRRRRRGGGLVAVLIQLQGVDQIVVNLGPIGQGVHFCQDGALVEQPQAGNQVGAGQAQRVPNLCHKALDAALPVVIVGGAVVEQAGLGADAGVPAPLGLLGDVEPGQILLDPDAHRGAQQRPGCGQLLIGEGAAAPVAPFGHQLGGDGHGGVDHFIVEVVAQNGAGILRVAALGAGGAPFQQLEGGGVDPAHDAHAHAADAGVDSAVPLAAGLQGLEHGDAVVYQLVDIDAGRQGAGLSRLGGGDEARAEAEHQQDCNDSMLHKYLSFGCDTAL